MNSKNKGQNKQNSKGKRERNVNSKGEEQQNLNSKRKERGEGKRKKGKKREKKCAALEKKRRGRYSNYVGSSYGWIGYPHPVHEGGTFNYFLGSFITFS